MPAFRPDPSMLSLATSTVKVLKKSTARDANGGLNSGYVAVPGLEAVPCSIGQASPQEASRFGQEVSSMVMKVEFYQPMDVGITHQYQETDEHTGDLRVYDGLGPADNVYRQNTNWLVYAVYRPDVDPG